MLDFGFSSALCHVSLGTDDRQITHAIESHSAFFLFSASPRPSSFILLPFPPGLAVDAWTIEDDRRASRDGHLRIATVSRRSQRCFETVGGGV